MPEAVPFTIKKLLKISRRSFTRWVDRTQDPGSAYMRMKNSPYIDLHINPKFRIPRGSSILTMGSCFARNIETRLHDEGMRVPTMDIGAPANWLVGERRANAFLNRFNVLAMLKEFRLGLGIDPVPANHYIPVREGLYVDPLQAALKYLPLSDLVKLRDRVHSTVQTLRSGGLVFLTLGLTETWFDLETNTPLNELPNPFLVKQFPDRFAFRALTYAEVEAALAEMVEIIQRAGLVKVVITVSPVPLLATYSDRDVVISNHASKSMLRTAAEVVSSSNPNVDYYPSYEMALYSKRWKTYVANDYRHVQNAAVAAITAKFIAEYVHSADSKDEAEAA